jgi:HEAT repeat protein
MRSNARLWTTALALLALAPSAAVVRTALADEDEDGQAAEALTSDQLTKKKREIVQAIPKDETVLINVASRDMPASPDVLNLGRRGTKALARCVSDNVDDGLRRLCAELLGRLGDREGLTALQGALEAWDAGVRGAAIGALRKMPDASSVAPLEKILHREDEEISNRAAALETLGAMSSGKAIPVLRAALHRPPHAKAEGDGEGVDGEGGAPDLRVAAFRGLWRSRHLVERGQLVGDVGYALGSNEPQLVLSATFAASELRAPALVPALVKLMKHPDTRVRNRAVYALGKIGDKTATRALLAQLPHVRESRMLNNIAFALERLDPQSFYATARDLVAHKQAQIRMNAAFVLGDVRRAEGLPLLQGALRDKNDMVRLSAVTAIGKLNTKQGEALLETYVDDPNPTLQRAAIYAIYALSGFSRTSLVYDKLYAPPDAPHKLEAAVALGKANDPRVTEDLLLCLETAQCSLAEVEGFMRASRSPDVPGRTLLAWTKGRSDLTELVAGLKPPGAGALARSQIQASLAQKEGPRALKAIDLTGDLTDAQAGVVLKALLGHENTRLRVHAAVALLRVGDADAIPALVRDLDNLPQDQLPSAVRLVGRVREPAARRRLAPELDKRARAGDVPLAVAAAAMAFEWEPEQGVFRMLAALAGVTAQERDLAEMYLVRDARPVTTELLRRALAREGRAAVRDRLRRILDLRADRANARD